MRETIGDNENIINDDEYEEENEIISRVEYETNNDIEKVIQRPSLINEENIGQVLRIIKDKLNVKNYSFFSLTNIAQNLIKAYIESNLDEAEEGAFLYYEVFERLKEASYIRREYLIPI